MYAARWLESLLFEVQARDPKVFASVSVVMIGVALFASYLPAAAARDIACRAAPGCVAGHLQ